MKLDRAKVNAVCEAALEALWRVKDENLAEGRDFRGRSYYVTPTELEKAVRKFLTAEFAGQPQPDGQCLEVRGFNLRQLVIDWLDSQWKAQKLEYHRIGETHRYRRWGRGLSEVEKNTLPKAWEWHRPWFRPVHYTTSYGGLPACFPPRGPYSERLLHRALTTGRVEQVTCAQCLKKLAEDEA